MASAIERALPAALKHVLKTEPAAAGIPRRIAPEGWQRFRAALPRVEGAGNPFRQWSYQAARQSELSAALARNFPRWVLAEASPHCRRGSRGASPSIPPILLLNLSLIALASASQDERAKIAPQHEMTRIDALLAKGATDRTTDEKIELFNYLLRHGEEEAQKAKGKDVVVVFGNTGAGKSTWINSMYGCQMARDDEGNVIVDPLSPVKEVATIGTEADSCTFIPKQIPDITFDVQTEGADRNPMMDETVSNREQCSLTLYDMPGLADNRGIEVALANVIVLKEIVGSAKSVRFVMVFEYGQIDAQRGVKWREAVRLLQEGFQDVLGKGGHSISLVVTKHKEGLDEIKKLIRKNTGSGQPDLSEYATVYDPLDSTKRGEGLETVFWTRSYRGLNNQVSMGKEQLWEALELGNEVAESVERDIQTGSPGDVALALQKVQFTHGIGKLGNKGLGEPHEKVSAAVRGQVESVLAGVESTTSGKLENNQLAAFEQYRMYREIFSPYMKFDKFDVRVNNSIERVKDPRWIAWDKGETSIVNGVVTVGLFVGGFFLPPLWFGAAGGVATTVTAILNWWNPSEKDKKITTFKNGV